MEDKLFHHFYPYSERGHLFEKVETVGPIKSFKVFKNGRFDLEFRDGEDALKLARVLIKKAKAQDG